MLMSNLLVPNSHEHLDNFKSFLETKTPFSFIRFSDGEIEIIRNRYLEIGGGKTVFRGREFKNSFPDFDAKKFDPRIHQNIRKDLLSSALLRDKKFYKGIPTLHNDAIKDREFLLRLNGGFELNMTFSDLFLNSNYLRYRKEIVPLFEKFEDIFVIANYRAKPIDILQKAHHIHIPDNFFAKYDNVINEVYGQIENIPDGSLVLSSASSLSNILGHKLFLKNSSITFLDIGTSINDLLSLSHNTRAYHNEEKSFFQKIFYRNKKGYEIIW
jgi:hypothetical protein